jgi:thioredoxin 1
MKRSTLALLVIAILLAAAVLAVNILTPPKAASTLPNGSPEDLDKALASGLPYVVKLGSENCAECKAIDPVLAEIATSMVGRATFIKIDVYKYPKMAALQKVTVIPTLLFFAAGGEKLAQTEGFMDVSGITSKMKSLGMI